jgi:hypothetical protein
LPPHPSATDDPGQVRHLLPPPTPIPHPNAFINLNDILHLVRE